MFVSKLILNVLNNKDALRDASNPYQMHRTLCRAFAVTADKCPEGRFIFRIEQGIDKETNGLVVIVQSKEYKADWQSLADMNNYLMQEPLEKQFEPVFRTGDTFHFRLHANPTVKKNKGYVVSASSVRTKNKDKYRCALYKQEEQIEWFVRKGEANGFKTLAVSAASQQIGNVYRKNKSETNDDTFFYKKENIPHLMVKFNGTLVVTNAEKFTEAFKNGIGTAKAFGMGLLSLIKT